MIRIGMKEPQWTPVASLMAKPWSAMPVGTLLLAKASLECSGVGPRAALGPTPLVKASGSSWFIFVQSSWVSEFAHRLKPRLRNCYEYSDWRLNRALQQAAQASPELAPFLWDGALHSPGTHYIVNRGFRLSRPTAPNLEALGFHSLETYE